jgi:glycine cleavage system pyridoxal-binding protein P
VGAFYTSSKTFGKKENHRTFIGLGLTFIKVAMIAKKDILKRKRAFTAYTPTIPAELD